jgi:hypothetical protein
VALVGGLLWGLLLIRRGESDPAVRLDCEQAAEARAEQPAERLTEQPEIRERLPETVDNQPDRFAETAPERIVGAAFRYEGNIYFGPNHIMALDRGTDGRSRHELRLNFKA